MAAILLARVTFPLWPPRRAVHPRTDARPRRSLLWAGDGRTDNLRYRRRRRASRNLFGYSQNASQTSGVVSAASHIGRLTRRCHRSNRSFRRGSGMFQRKKGGSRKRQDASWERKASKQLIAKRASRVLASWPSIRAGTGLGRGFVKCARGTFCEGYVLSLTLVSMYFTVQLQYSACWIMSWTFSLP